MHNDSLINNNVYQVLCNVYNKIKNDISIKGNLLDSFDENQDTILHESIEFPLNKKVLLKAEQALVKQFASYKNLEFKVPSPLTDTYYFKVITSAILYIETMVVRVSQVVQYQHGKKSEGIIIDFIFNIEGENQNG